MLGIGCPDRHALPRVNLVEICRARRVLPSRASGFVLRRILAVAARSGDGPFTIRFADLHHRAMQTGGLVSWRSTPCKPPEGNEGAQGVGKVLEVLGETPVASEPGES